MIITMSPLATFLAAGPFNVISPLFRGPGIAYVSRRSPLFIFTIETFSPSLNLFFFCNSYSRYFDCYGWIYVLLDKLQLVF